MNAQVIWFLTLFSWFQCFRTQRFYDVSMKEKIQETIVLKKALQTFHNQKSQQVAKDLLCSTVLQTEEQYDWDIMKTNYAVMHDKCDWIIFLSKEVKHLPSLCRKKQQYTNIRHCLPLQHVSNQSLPEKTLFYLSLKPFLKDYQRVMLIDRHYSLLRLNYLLYMKVWNCGFWPGHPPLITQPLLYGEPDHENGRRRNLFNDYQTWQYARRRRVWAAETVFIQPDVLFLHSAFLQWMIEDVLPRLIEAVPAEDKSSDVSGLDFVWCHAAYMYGRYVLGYKREEYVPCALIVKGLPAVYQSSANDSYRVDVSHVSKEPSPTIIALTSHTLSVNDEVYDFIRRSKAIEDAIGKVFPTWIITSTFYHDFNPVTFHNEHMIKRHKLSKECFPYNFNTFI
eukprot:gene811-864_t